MGKGDRRSRRGKIWRGTYGKYRPRKIQKALKARQKVLARLQGIQDTTA